MQYMAHYYEINTRFRYYGRLPEATKVDGGHISGKLGSQKADVTRWKDPPHERIANLGVYVSEPSRGPTLAKTPSSAGFADPKAVEAFVKKHGILMGRFDELTQVFYEDTVAFANAQELLQRAWRRDDDAIKEIEKQIELSLEARPSVQAGGVELTTENLWSFTCVLFLRDYALGKAKVCASPDCSHPYFLETRKGQKYCSHLCAVRENVRRFRKAGLHPKQQKIARKRGRRSVGHGTHKTW